MKIAMFTIVVLFFVNFGPCGAPTDQDLPKSIQSDSTVWVGIVYQGGVQCDTTVKYSPPDVRQVLGSANIVVLGTQIEGYAVCAACGCPSYAAMHYALIYKNDLLKAKALGFQQKNPPAN